MDGNDRKAAGTAGASAGGMRLTVITPEEAFYDGVVESVVVRTPDGYMGFLPNRAPACVLLHDEGRLRFREQDAEQKSVEPKGAEAKSGAPKSAEPQSDMVRAFLDGGFAFVDEEVTIYTDQARWQRDEEDDSV